MVNNDEKDDFEGNSERTAILGFDQETINRELQKAKEQPACLILIRGTPQGHRFFITGDEMIIGRDPTADITIPDSSISRKHAKVIKEGNVIKIEDLGSSNGTAVNGKKLEKGAVAKLAKEDLIKLGNTIVKYLPAGEIEIIFYGNLNQAANTDPLTKCFNKGYFLEAIEAEVKRAKALSTKLSLIFFDLDHFKKVNDTYGHEGGDFVLKEFTGLIRSFGLLKQKDIFARYGGEEFCLMMPATSLEEAGEIAETLRGKIHGHDFIYEGKRIPVTTSLGVAELASHHDTSSDLIKASDKALYESKQGGRNRVTLAHH
jgi:two-component system cell cycle response regulator